MRSKYALAAFSGVLLSSLVFAADQEPVIAFQIQVSNAQGTASYGVPLRECTWNPTAGTLNWVAPETSIPLLDGQSGAVVASIDHISYNGAWWPRGRVWGDFGLTAGASDTAIHISLPHYEFLQIPAAQAAARAWVSIDITDANSDGLVRLVTDGEPGDGTFKAKWIANGQAQTFASLIYFLEAQTIPGQSAGTINVNDAVPPSGFQATGQPADGLTWSAAFILTAGDSVNIRGGMSMDKRIDLITCPGDVNASYTFDVVDLTQTLSAFGECGYQNFDLRLDVIVDGCLNLYDLLMQLSRFAQTCD